MYKPIILKNFTTVVQAFSAERTNARFETRFSPFDFLFLDFSIQKTRLQLYVSKLRKTDARSRKMAQGHVL